MTASQKLKVNQRHQRKLEMRNRTNTRSYDTASVQSSNMNKLSQMQGGLIGITEQAAQIDQAQINSMSPSPILPNHASSMGHTHNKQN